MISSSKKNRVARYLDTAQSVHGSPSVHGGRVGIRYHYGTESFEEQVKLFSKAALVIGLFG